MIPYMVGKLAPNSSHLTRGLVKYVPGRGYFRAVPSQNRDKCVTSPPPPIVDFVELQIFHKENLLYSELQHSNVTRNPVLFYQSFKKSYDPHLGH